MPDLRVLPLAFDNHNSPSVRTKFNICIINNKV